MKTPTSITEMTARELRTREAIIERGKRAFVEVGNALAEIRDRRGYKAAGFETFEAYCRARWDWSYQNAAYYIGAAKVAEEISTQVENLEFTQARELARLAAPAAKGDKRRKEIDLEAVKEVAAGIDFSKATSKTVAKAVNEKLSRLRQQRKNTPPAKQAGPMEADRYRLLVCDIADLPGQLPHQVDAIITDPPYQEEFLPVYGELAKAAVRLLKPGCARCSSEVVRASPNDGRA